jgi:hypothetical protein
MWMVVVVDVVAVSVPFALSEPSSSSSLSAVAHVSQSSFVDDFRQTTQTLALPAQPSQSVRLVIGSPHSNALLHVAQPVVPDEDENPMLLMTPHHAPSSFPLASCHTSASSAVRASNPRSPCARTERTAGWR